MPYSSMQELKEKCADCRRCKLCEERTRVVFGVGDEHSRLLFIGEGPGENEDLQGEPFVGRAGKLLDKLLITIGLDRSTVYIANIVKCRPPQNRDPLPEEQEACIPYLREQVRLIQPKLIVCLGRIAAQRIISPDFKVTRQHGQWIERKGVYLMGTFHPAAILRNQSQMPAALSDFISIQQMLLSYPNKDTEEKTRVDHQPPALMHEDGEDTLN